MEEADAGDGWACRMTWRDYHRMQDDIYEKGVVVNKWNGLVQAVR